MTRYRINLVDIVCMSKKEYAILEQSIRDKAQVTVVLNSLSECRKIINNNMARENILRLLLYSMNNNMIKSQYYGVKSRYFSLYLTTFIKLMSQYFADKDKLFLAQTNPAVDNLKRKVNVAKCKKALYDLGVTKVTTPGRNTVRAIV